MKRKLERPQKKNLSEDPVLRSREIANKHRQKHNLKALTVHGDMAEAFHNAKDQYNENLPYSVNTKQFFSVLLDHWSKQYDRT